MRTALAFFFSPRASPRRRRISSCIEQADVMDTSGLEGLGRRQAQVIQGGHRKDSSELHRKGSERTCRNFSRRSPASRRALLPIASSQSNCMGWGAGAGCVWPGARQAGQAQQGGAGCLPSWSPGQPASKAHGGQTQPVRRAMLAGRQPGKDSQASARWVDCAPAACAQPARWPSSQTRGSAPDGDGGIQELIWRLRKGIRWMMGHQSRSPDTTSDASAPCVCRGTVAKRPSSLNHTPPNHSQPHLVLAAGQGMGAEAAQHRGVGPPLLGTAHNQAVHAQTVEGGMAGGRGGRRSR